MKTLIAIMMILVAAYGSGADGHKRAHPDPTMVSNASDALDKLRAHPEPTVRAHPDPKATRFVLGDKAHPEPSKAHPDLMNNDGKAHPDPLAHPDPKKDKAHSAHLGIMQFVEPFDKAHPKPAHPEPAKRAHPDFVAAHPDSKKKVLGRAHPEPSTANGRAHPEPSTSQRAHPDVEASAEEAHPHVVTEQRAHPDPQQAANADLIAAFKAELEFQLAQLGKGNDRDVIEKCLELLKQLKALETFDIDQLPCAADAHPDDEAADAHPDDEEELKAHPYPKAHPHSCRGRAHPEPLQ